MGKCMAAESVPPGTKGQPSFKSGNSLGRVSMAAVFSGDCLSLGNISFGGCELFRHFQFKVIFISSFL